MLPQDALTAHGTALNTVIIVTDEGLYLDGKPTTLTKLETFLKNSIMAQADKITGKPWVSLELESAVEKETLIDLLVLLKTLKVGYKQLY